MTAHSLASAAGAPEREKIRVLTLVDGIGTYGGAESLAREIVMRLDAERFERAFCVSRWDPATLEDLTVQTAMAELDEAGVRFIGLERFGRPALRPWGRLIRDLRERPVDILHSHKFGSNVWGALIAPLARVPAFVAHEHSWAFEGRPLRRLLDRQLIARSADVIVAVSAEDRRRMTSVEGIPARMIELIPNGIADPPPSKDRTDVRAELGISPDTPVIGTVATLRPYKGVDVLIEAAALLVAECPDLQALVAGGDEGGDPTVREGLRGLIAELGLERNVRLLGFRDDVPAVIEAFDVAVCSSDFEGSPLSVMEYMEEAKPVVATAVGGIPDLISEGVNGALVERRNPAALAAAIAPLLADSALRDEMGARGRELRRAEYSIEATVRNVAELYERLTAADGTDG
jgi:glycosyltransferase involved in cell wall biosynthesis